MSAQPSLDVPATHETYCLLCDKPGHITTDCWSTHGLNTPKNREIMRLTTMGSTPAERARLTLLRFG